MAINLSVQSNGGLLPDIILLIQCNYHRGTRLNAMNRFRIFFKRKIRTHLDLLSIPRKNKCQNVKRLGRIKGCKYKTSPWHLNGFPDGNNIGSTV